MKFLARLIPIAILSYFVPHYSPWWILFFTSAAIGYLIPGNGFNVFNAGFLGAGIVWIAYAFLLGTEMSAILSGKIATLMQVNDPTYLILATGLIGALISGLAAQSGNSFRQIFMKKKKKTGFYS